MSPMLNLLLELVCIIIAIAAAIVVIIAAAIVVKLIWIAVFFGWHLI